VEADIPKQVVQETPELSLLLRATILPLKEGATEAEVHVHAINLPGHTPIVIHSVRPEKVKIKK
jgi:hypothetical protein